ncbi:MAG: aminopeptidase P family protein, partial [Candidatus Omnitrophica bacterium]|nr:aminopeptidase P family protein [Candidatus Omnitrophota bacterium]
MNSARLIIADSEKNANLYYATRFLAPDSFIFIQVGSRRFLLMSDLELDRAKAQAQVDEVLSYTVFAQDLKKLKGKEPTMMDVVGEFLKAYNVSSVEVPADFGVTYADALRQRDYKVTPKPEPFFPERMLKSEEE